jgi:hypothetical protein
MILIRVLDHLVPNPKVIISGEPTTKVDYEKNVTWLDSRTKPSWEEIQNAQAVVEQIIANEKASQARASDFRIEADPLFFGWQRNENTEQEWLDKVAEIRARYPYA